MIWRENLLKMLVLSRNRDESIMIGDDVVVTIVDIRGDKVRLGIDAPQDIPVHRQEVYDAIKKENAKAGKMWPGDKRMANPSYRANSIFSKDDLQVSLESPVSDYNSFNGVSKLNNYCR